MDKLRILALLALCGGFSAVRAEDPLNLTLEQALRLTDSANVTVLLSREAAAQAVAVANQQRVGVLPNVALHAQQGRAAVVNIVNNAPVLSPAANSYYGKLTGSFAVLNPQQFSAWRAARTGVAVAQLEAQATLQSMLATVSESYFAHLRNLRRIVVLDANVERAQKLLTLAQNLFNGGVATQIDVTRADALVAQAQLARLQHQTTVVASELLLKRLLDLDLRQPLDLKDFIVRRVAAGEYVFGRERTAFELRADYLRAQKALDQAKLDLRTARFGRLPIFSLTGEYGYASTEFNDSSQKTAWLAAASVSLPIFDGLRTSADSRLALSRQRAQELQLRNLEQQIGAELRLATQDADSRNAQIVVAEKSLRLAEDEYRLARNRFEAGAADNREVVDAQNQLAVASDGLVEAVYQYNLARVELARVKGDVRTILQEKTE
jgi:outer membrane protein TolC